MKFKKLVVLDKVEMTPEQEKQIKELAEGVSIFNDTPKDAAEAISRIGDADCLITSWTEITKEILDGCPNIKYMGVVATGYSWIDVAHANSKGIIVTSVPGYSTESVAELVIGQIIALVRKTRQADAAVREGRFEQVPFLGEELSGKTIGIIGLGRIGSHVAELAQAFGMKVIYYGRTKKDAPYEFVPLEELVRRADIVTLHASSGGCLLGEKELASMKDGSIVVNFGIAGAVDEDALIAELKKGRLRAVLDHYVDHKIKQGFREARENAVLTPEIGYNTKEAVERLTQISIDNTKSYLAGKTQNVVTV